MNTGLTGELNCDRTVGRNVEEEGYLRRSSRVRTLSEKAKQGKVMALEDKFTLSHRDLLKSILDIEQLLSASEVDTQELDFKRTDLSAKLNSLQGIVESLREIQAGDFNKSVEKILNDVTESTVKTISKIVQVCTFSSRTTSPEIPRSHHSKSSVTSTTSRTSSRRAVAAAEAAALQAKLEARRRENQQLKELEILELEETKRKKAAEQKIALLKRKLEEERLEAELRAEEARMRVYDNESMHSTKESVILERTEGPLLEVDSQNRLLSNSCLNPTASPFKLTSSEHSSLADAIAGAMSVHRLPVPEPPVFYGDPLQYPDWSASFSALIESRSIPNSEKIHYLKRYLGGQAKESVNGYFLLRSEDAYQKAKSILEKRFGNSFAISEAFRTKLDCWPKIQSKDGKGLRRLTDFLQQCCVAIAELPELNVLNDMREIKKISEKLPEWLTNRWNRQLAHDKRDFGRYPNFARFASFLTEEAEIVTDPILLSETSSACRLEHHIPKKSKPTNAGTVFVMDSSQRSSCLYCNRENHHITMCREFGKKPMKDKKEYVMKQRLCFGCLSLNHMSKQCPKRSICKKCSKHHPTSLHDDTPKHAENLQHTEKLLMPNKVDVHKGNNCRVSVTDCNQLTSMVLPVYLSSLEDPDKEVCVYALLDSMSDSTFILHNIADNLQAESETAVLSLTTMTDQKTVKCRRFSGLQIRGFQSQDKIRLPPTYSREHIPLDESHIPTPETARKWPHLRNVADLLQPKLDCPIGLLIGYNCSRALAPKNCILGENDQPFAVETELGWSIVGGNGHHIETFDAVGQTHRIITKVIPDEIGPKPKQDVTYILKTSVKEVTASDLLQIMEKDFHDSESATMSQDDFKFLNIMENGILQRSDGYYEMPLPFKEGNPDLPNNKIAALQRIKGLQKQFKRRPVYKDHYTSFMSDIIAREEAEKVPVEERNKDCIWYIPHHGVYHAKKPNKVRVVFDCSARYQDTSLNDHLLQGPDLNNPLVGVLCRFRKESIAFSCDIEKMYHQFRVQKQHQDYLRFLWWETDNFSAPPVDYRMKVHLFGATSSPGCANFGLKQMAEDHKDINLQAANFIKTGFYVDDGLASVATEKEAIKLISDTIAVCKQGNLRLHKFVSNSSNVLNSIPESERSESSKADLALDSSSIERTLGLQWCIQSDCFRFRLTLKDNPLTRRGILATVASIYDPLGWISPLVLTGRQILQKMCQDHMGWDQLLPDELKPAWEKWKQELSKLDQIKISRCYHPVDFGCIEVVELHHFSDASLSGYGQCSYLRLRDDKGHIHCSLVMAKSRVTPLKAITVPRLELQAATLSVKIAELLDKELKYSNLKHYFWTDSKVVLGYIKNQSKRFHMYVANRVQRIHQTSVPDQWHYINTKDNPADHTSRGLSAGELSTSNWFCGPRFLWEKDIIPEEVKIEVLSDDAEVKSTVVRATQGRKITTFEERISKFSSYNKLISAVTVLIRRQLYLKKDVSTVEARRLAERSLVKVIQKEVFGDKKKLEEINSLDPFLDEHGVLRVGGRLKKASLMYGVKHPIILPKNSHLSHLVARHYHEKMVHQGRNFTINAVRSGGFWIVGCRAIVSSLTRNCVQCIRFRSKPIGQKMADLPQERVEPSSPFTYCGMDCFGPFLIKEGRKEIKKYGLILTCLSMRAVHIEVLDDMSTDSLINALRCFIALRGHVRTIRCDQGTNFIGAKHELKQALEEIKDEKISAKLAEINCEFKMNPPSSSHMGGVWERQIRNIRNVLNGILYSSGTQLNSSSLRTFLYEAMAIVNSRPLTIENLESSDSIPLTPNHLLTMKSGVVMPPPGKFESEDLYLRKRWRRVQYLVNQFWQRWRKEYLQTLQSRHKWKKPQANISVDDIVILQEDGLIRTEWKTARVIEANTDEDGLVRKVKLLMSTSQLDEHGRSSQKRTILERPVHKLVLLLSGHQ